MMHFKTDFPPYPLSAAGNMIVYGNMSVCIIICVDAESCLSKLVCICAWRSRQVCVLCKCMCVRGGVGGRHSFYDRLCGLLNYALNFYVFLCILCSVNRPDSSCFSLQTQNTKGCGLHTGGCTSASRVPLSWLSMFKQTQAPSLILCCSRWCILLSFPSTVRPGWILGRSTLCS